LGFDITEDDCLRVSDGEAVGRPHIVAAINSKPSNISVIEKIRLELYLVNNGSWDKSQSIIEKIKKVGFKVKILSEDKKISKTQYHGIALESLKVEATK